MATYQFNKIKVLSYDDFSLIIHIN